MANNRRDGLSCLDCSVVTSICTSSVASVFGRLGKAVSYNVYGTVTPWFYRIYDQELTPPSIWLSYIMPRTAESRLFDERSDA